MTPSPHRRFIPRLTFGLLLILLGVGLALDNSGLLPVNVWHLFWPCALLLFGFSALVSRGFLHLGGHVLLFFGTAFLLGALGYGDVADRWWPLGFVWAGVVIVLRALQAPFPQTCQDFESTSHE